MNKITNYSHQLGVQSEVSPGQRQRLPSLFVLVIFMTFLSWVLNIEIGGYRIAGWSWVFSNIAGLLVLGYSGLRSVKFPFRFWGPWVALVICWWCLFGNHPNSFQTLVQILTPLVVGCAVSTFHFLPAHLEIIYSWLSKLFYVVLVILFVKLPMLLFLKLPVYGMMPAEAITCGLLGAIYVAFYSTGGRHYLLYYIGMLLFPVIMLTRGPFLAVAAAFPLSLSPVRMWQRFLFGGLMLLMGLLLFYSERYQKMMFHSGKGTIEEVRWDNENLHTSGRKSFWETLWDSWLERPWTGHGLNASRTVLFDKGYTLYLPHNDWLKMLHDTGIIGAGFYAAGILLQVLALLRIAHITRGKLQAIAYASASAFVPFVIIMCTDNVTLYVQYYSNLHFAMIGAVYGAIGHGGRQ